jgi:hypothetical protein
LLAICEKKKKKKKRKEKKKKSWDRTKDDQNVIYPKIKEIMLKSSMTKEQASKWHIC